MSEAFATVPPVSLRVSIIDGNMLISAIDAEKYFGSGVIGVRANGRYLDVYPLNSSENGGTYLKTRDSHKNRSAFIEEVLREIPRSVQGSFVGTWSVDFGCFKFLIHNAEALQMPTNANDNTLRIQCTQGSEKKDALCQ